MRWEGRKPQKERSRNSRKHKPPMHSQQQHRHSHTDLSSATLSTRSRAIWPHLLSSSGFLPAPLAPATLPPPHCLPVGSPYLHGFPDHLIYNGTHCNQPLPHPHGTYCHLRWLIALLTCSLISAHRRAPPRPAPPHPTHTCLWKTISVAEAWPVSCTAVALAQAMSAGTAPPRGPLTASAHCSCAHAAATPTPAASIWSSDTW